jgi:glutamate decarboxylase
MVHINRVATTAEVEASKNQFDGVDTLAITPEEEEDSYTATVYGSKYAAEDLPRHEMPEREMPPQVAYRMIKDDLTLDGTPTLNLASFVTTYMVSWCLESGGCCGRANVEQEEEAEKLMVYATTPEYAPNVG